MRLASDAVGGVDQCEFNFLPRLYGEFLDVVNELDLVGGQGDLNGLLRTGGGSPGKDGSGGEDAKESIHVMLLRSCSGLTPYLVGYFRLRRVLRNGRFFGQFEKNLKMIWIPLKKQYIYGNLNISR